MDTWQILGTKAEDDDEQRARFFNKQKPATVGGLLLLQSK
jgi:hypothetical protein